MTRFPYASSIATSIILLSIGINSSAHAAYTFTDLGTLGGTNSTAVSVNDNGQIVGWGLSPIYGESRPAYWNGSTLSDLGTLGGSFGFAYQINNSGQIAGWTANTEGIGRATLWNGGAAFDLGTLGGSYSEARAINDAGQVAGFSYLSGNTASHATLWNNGSINDLGVLSGWQRSFGVGINNAGQVVGASNTDNVGRATLWSGTTITDLGTLGGQYQYSAASAINDTGQIVGYSYTSGNTAIHATLWNNGTITDLGTFSGLSRSFARDINSAGIIVGSVSAGDGTTALATMWDGSTIIDLNSLLDTDTISAGWILRSADSINDHGWIVGRAYNNFTHQSHGYLLSEAATIPAVPEPEAYAMLFAGLGLLSFTARRRKHSA